MASHGCETAMNEKRAVWRRRSGAMWRQIAAATRHRSLFCRYLTVKCQKGIFGVFVRIQKHTLTTGNHLPANR